MTILKFEIVTHHDIHEFEDAIFEHIHKGWEICGDLYVEGKRFFIPIVLNDEEKESDEDIFYTVVNIQRGYHDSTEENVKLFESEVNGLINEGWELVGKTIIKESGFYQLMCYKE